MQLISERALRYGCACHYRIHTRHVRTTAQRWNDDGVTMVTFDAEASQTTSRKLRD